MVRLESVAFYGVKRDYTGKIVARRKSELSFERQGNLIRITLEEGQRVRAAWRPYAWN